jgi:hypothetical protein
LPKEEGRSIRNIKRPKHNFQKAELDRLLKSLWKRKDLGFINERSRIQFHLQLVWFAAAGARSGGILKEGIPYKVGYTHLGFLGC